MPIKKSLKINSLARSTHSPGMTIIQLQVPLMFHVDGPEAVTFECAHVVGSEAVTFE